MFYSLVLWSNNSTLFEIKDVCLCTAISWIRSSPTPKYKKYCSRNQLLSLLHQFFFSTESFQLSYKFTLDSTCKDTISWVHFSIQILPHVSTVSKENILDWGDHYTPIFFLKISSFTPSKVSLHLNASRFQQWAHSANSDG